MKKINSALLKMVFLLLAVCLITTAAIAGDEEENLYIKPAITAEQAVSAVNNALPKLTAGRSFIKTGEQARKKLEVALVFDGKVISKMKLDPVSGEILPKGQKTLAHNVSVSREQAVKIVQQAIPSLEVASVKLGEHGVWKADLTLKKVVVASVKVRGTDGSILADWQTMRDAIMN